MSDWLTCAVQHITGRAPTSAGSAVSYLGMLADMQRSDPSTGVGVGVHTEEQARSRVREMCLSLARVLVGDAPRACPADPDVDERTLRAIVAVLGPMGTDPDVVERCRARLLGGSSTRSATRDVVR